MGRGTLRMRRMAGMTALLPLLVTSAVAAPAPPEGSLRLEVLSTRADMVTGGDALVRVVAPDRAVRLTRDGEDVTVALRPGGPDELIGLVDGLGQGQSLLEARVPGGATAGLQVTNHPITGPVFSGPHQTPFICETEAAGLGPPLDGDCSVATSQQWYYLPEGADAFSPLADPYGPYPADTATTTTSTGATVPYVVRVESATINRGITRIAVLDDPATRGPDAPYSPSAGWNRKIVHTWGPSCGVAYHQGTNAAEDVLVADHLGDGYLYQISTMTTLGTHCNDVLSAETFMMIREHITEQYGVPDFVMGDGGSGGSVQQHTTANNYPGLIDGLTLKMSFPDVVTPMMTLHDCILLNRAYAGGAVGAWTEHKRQAINGHRTGQVCLSYELLFSTLYPRANAFEPDICGNWVPAEVVYDPVDNRGGVRCTVWDAARNVWGVDPATGFARRPLDNIGIQYGLKALNEGAILPREFIELNRSIGGLDIDGNWQSQRTEADPEALRVAYETGRLVGRGALDEVPVIDYGGYWDVQPPNDIHDEVRAYQLRARLDRTYGGHANQTLWNTQTGVNQYDVMDTWLTAIDADAAPGGPAERTVRNKPPLAADRCLNEQREQRYGGDDLCARVLSPLASPRMVAGGPLTEDVLKCQLKPIDFSDYRVPLLELEKVELRATFPDGVCDWTRPPVGYTERSATWVSFGADTATGPVQVGPAPEAVVSGTEEIPQR